MPTFFTQPDYTGNPPTQGAPMASNLLDSPIATLVVLALVAIGGIQVITNDLSFEEFIRLIDVPVAGLAVGRGLAARKAG